MAYLLGGCLIGVALVDIFLTVLYPRSGKGLLSVPLSKAVWWVFCVLATGLKRRSPQRSYFLSFCGPAVLLTIVSMWVALLLVGFAYLVWPALGTAIQAPEDTTPTDFIAALYYSGYSLTTLGFGDLAPKTDFYRLLTILAAGLGFSIFTLTITYLISVYGALTQRNVFAIGLYHRAGSDASAAELLARLGATHDLSIIYNSLEQMALNALMLLESHHAYPVLHYFRFTGNYYAFARIALLIMDTATLIRSTLHEKTYQPLLHSAALVELEEGGHHLLVEVTQTFLPSRCFKNHQQSEAVLRDWYDKAIARLQQEGIETVSDIEAGADRYVALRRRWEPYVMAIADYMAYDWAEIAPAETGLTATM